MSDIDVDVGAILNLNGTILKYGSALWFDPGETTRILGYSKKLGQQEHSSSVVGAILNGSIASSMTLLCGLPQGRLP